MTREQVLWASQHDWFIKAVPCEKCGYRVEAKEVWSDGAEYNVKFTSYRELREWAGY